MNTNMFAGAFLGTVFVMMTLGIVSEAIFEHEAPEEQGFAIVVPEGEGGATGGGEAAPSGPEPIAPLLASADPAAGEGVFKKCASCHNIEAGAGNKVGPNLHNVVGRDIASVADFKYSSAMTEHGNGTQWSYDELNGFLTKPKAWVSGTSMGFAGISKVEDRANLIAYLAQNTENPPAFPDPAAAAAPAEESAATEEAPAAEEAAPAAEEAAPAAEEAAPAATEEAAPAAEEAPAEGETAPAQ